MSYATAQSLRHTEIKKVLKAGRKASRSSKFYQRECREVTCGAHDGCPAWAWRRDPHGPGRVPDRSVLGLLPAYAGWPQSRPGQLLPRPRTHTPHPPGTGRGSHAHTPYEPGLGWRGSAPAPAG